MAFDDLLADLIERMRELAFILPRATIFGGGNGRQIFGGGNGRHLPRPAAVRMLVTQ